jgi:hypothetical protein
MDGVLPPAAVRRQLNKSAWHLGCAPALHDLPGHLGAAMLHPGLLAPPDHRATAFSRPLSLGGPWRNFLLWLDLSSTGSNLARLGSHWRRPPCSSRATSETSIPRRLITLVFAGWLPHVFVRRGLPLTIGRASGPRRTAPMEVPRVPLTALVCARCLFTDLWAR